MECAPVLPAPRAATPPPTRPHPPCLRRAGGHRAARQTGWEQSRSGRAARGCVGLRGRAGRGTDAATGSSVSQARQARQEGSTAGRGPRRGGSSRWLPQCRCCTCCRRCTGCRISHTQFEIADGGHSCCPGQAMQATQQAWGQGRARAHRPLPRSRWRPPESTGRNKRSRGTGQWVGGWVMGTQGAMRDDARGAPGASRYTARVRAPAAAPSSLPPGRYPDRPTSPSASRAPAGHAPPPGPRWRPSCSPAGSCGGRQAAGAWDCPGPTTARSDVHSIKPFTQTHRHTDSPSQPTAWWHRWSRPCWCSCLREAGESAYSNGHAGTSGQRCGALQQPRRAVLRGRLRCLTVGARGVPGQAHQHGAVAAVVVVWRWRRGEGVPAAAAAAAASRPQHAAASRPQHAQTQHLRHQSQHHQWIQLYTSAPSLESSRSSTALRTAL